MTYVLIIAAGSIIGYAPLYDTTCAEAVAQLEDRVDPDHFIACATEETTFKLLDGVS